MTDTTCDTADLVMYHRFLQHSFRASETLIDRALDGDAERSRLVADHLEALAQNLHDHHHGEDILLWDTMEQRAPACAMHVEAMKLQHTEIVALVTTLQAALPAWASSASATDKATVRWALIDLENALDAHLGDEESRILPIAGTMFAQKEWDRLAEHGRKSVPASRVFLQLGMMLDSMSPADRAAFLGELPPPVRVLWRVVGKPRYRRYLASLGADPSPTLAAA